MCVTAIQSRALPGIDRPPYSATFPDYFKWLIKKYLLRPVPWLNVMRDHICGAGPTREKQEKVQEIKPQDSEGTPESFQKQVEIAKALHSIRPEIPMVVCEKRVSKAVGDGSLPNVRNRKKYPDGVPRNEIEKWLEVEAQRSYTARQRKFSSDCSDYF
jgi:hypothetical protein